MVRVEIPSYNLEKLEIQGEPVNKTARGVVRNKEEFQREWQDKPRKVAEVMRSTIQATW